MARPTFITMPIGSALPTDPAPNTTAPTDLQTFEIPADRATQASALYAVAVGGTVTLQIWAYIPQFKRWAAVGTATACAADTVVTLPTPPTGMLKLFAQVTANSGATQFCVGITGGR